MTKFAVFAGLLLLSFATPALAQLDEEPYTFVVSRDGGLYEFLWMIATPDGFNVGPIDADKTINLGRPIAPWQNGYFSNTVSASRFLANGQPGLNTVIHVGGCLLTFQGGLIVSATTPGPFGSQPCP